MTALFLISFALFAVGLAGSFAQEIKPYLFGDIPKGSMRQIEAINRAAPLPLTEAFTLSWPANVGTLVIESSTDFINWIRIATNSTGALIVTNDLRLGTLIAPYMTRLNFTNMDHRTVGGRGLYYNGGTYFRGVVVSGIATNTATQSVALAWDKSGDPSVTSYKVVYGSNGPLNYTNSASVKGVSATIPNLIPGLTYYFSAVACNADGESDFSNEISYTVPPGAALKTEPFKLSIRKL